MKVFQHHLYEYRKGLRNLILHTILADCRSRVEARLTKEGIAYEIYALSNGHMNVFFGAVECVNVIRAIGKSQLKDYTVQEDFILGIMLGYDRLLQCRRYLEMVSSGTLKHREQNDDAPATCHTIRIQTRGLREAAVS